MMSKNYGFLLISPDASNDAFRKLTKNFLFEHEIDVEEEGIVYKDELIRQRWVEKCYPLIRRYSMLNGFDFNRLMTNQSESAESTTAIQETITGSMESIKSRFFSLFQELWDTVVEEGRLLSAKEAMVHFGDVSPQVLSAMWWDSFFYEQRPRDLHSIPGKLVPGCYIARLLDAYSREYYVINGFYPALAERWVAGPQPESMNHSVTWMSLSWKPSRHSIKRLQENIFGAIDPLAAAEGTLRKILYTDYMDLNIYRPPAQECCGFDIFLNPLEALAQQCIWTRRPLIMQPFGRQLLQEGLPSRFITRLLSNPLLISAGRVTSAYELAEKMPNAKLIRRLSELYWSLREEEKEAAEERKPPLPKNADASEEPAGPCHTTAVTVLTTAPTAVYDLLGTETYQPISLTEGCEEEEEKYQRNCAVVFIKPHAYNKLVFAAVTETLGQLIPDLSFDHVCDADAHLIETRQLVDHHYKLISYYAMECDPSTLILSEIVQREFEEVFQVQWKDVVGSGRLWNAKTAMSLLGQWSPKGLYDLWEETPKKVTLTSGAYVCQIRLEGGETYIINGFYPYVRDMFTTPGARIRCYIISWPEKKLSWKSFRTNVIGCTNPASAPKTSLRGHLYHHWRALHLPAPPDMTNNGIHASAGPVEAMVERHLWFGVPYDSDVLTQRVLRRGFTPATLFRWATNPVVTVRGDASTTALAFDLLSNRDTNEVLEMMRAAESIDEIPKGQAEPSYPVPPSTDANPSADLLQLCIAEESAPLHGIVSTSTALNRALVFLHPNSTSYRTINVVTEMLQRAGIVIIAQRDVFAHEATAAILDTACMRDVASSASLFGEALYESVSLTARERFEEVFQCPWNDVMDDVMGADEVLKRFPLLTPYDLMDRCASAPEPGNVKLDRQLHVCYLKKEGVYVVNGFYPYLREAYTSPGSYVHLFEVTWREEDWTWKDFNDVVIGHREVDKADVGSLQRIIAENWKEFGLFRRPMHRAGCSISASRGPIEAVVDRLRWLTPEAERSAKVLEDPFVQELLRYCVPLEQILYLLEGYEHLSTYDSFKEEQALRQELSTNQQTSHSVSLIRAHSRRLQDSLDVEHGFIYLQPFASTDRVKSELLAFLFAHQINVVEYGSIPMDEIIERQLLNPPTDPLFRNGMTRKASEIPITHTEKKIFFDYFHMTWETAVELSLILNSAQHVARVGETTAMEQWEAAEMKVCLSPTLYVAYIEVEGLYVMNGFFSFFLPRLHAGHEVFWCSLTWEEEVWSYDDFLKNVIGAENPTMAAPGSFRQVLSENWEAWGMSMPLDALENGIFASRSPIEALSERCRWLLTLPENDFFGRQLLQSGIHARFLEDAIQNPIAHLKGDLIQHSTEFFFFLPRSSRTLCESLLSLQRSYELTLLPYDTTITSARPAALLSLDEDHLWEKENEEELDGNELVVRQERAKELGEQKLVTLILRRGISTAYAYSAPMEPEIPMAARQWWLNGRPPLGDKSSEPQFRGARQVSPALKESYAILCLVPTYWGKIGKMGAGIMLALLKDLLSVNHIKVWMERDVPASEAEQRHVFEAQFDRLIRYSTKIPGKKSITKEIVKKYSEETGMLFSSDLHIFNALELASAFNLTARKVDLVWEKCVHHVRVGQDLYLARVPTEEMLLVNGFGLQFQEDFCHPDTTKHFLMVSWDACRLSYQKLRDDIIGSSYIPLARASSFHGVLREKWQVFGLPHAPQEFTGAVSVSESALDAMKHRQAWMGIGLLADPLGRESLTTGAVSPVVLRRALHNPITPQLLSNQPEGMDGVGGKNGKQERIEGGKGKPFRGNIPLLDHLINAENEETLAWLRELEHLYRQEPTRNTAFALVKPHALCKRFARRVEHMFEKHGISIDEEGDIVGEEVHRRGLVRYLYPVAAGYAVRPPASLKLSDEEQHRVYTALNVTWKELVLSHTVLNAYEALEVLGDITPRQLCQLWLASGKNRVIVRPDLEITRLPGQTLYVVNAYFPALKQSFESPDALLHWYVISWPEQDLTWKDFNANVIGAVDPSNAQKESIRGHLYHRWRDYGLRCLPDRIQNGIHVSVGPLQGLGERITFLERPIAEDPLGEMIMRLDIHPGLLESWLDNPDITIHDTTAGVFEHMTGISTSRLLQTMVILSDDMRARERGENAQPTERVEDSYLLEAGSIDDATEGKKVNEEALNESLTEEEQMNMSWRSDLPWTEEPIVYRNTAVLIIKPHVSHSQGVKALLLDVLKEHKVRVLSQEEREGSTWLVDRIWFTRAFFAMCPQLAEVLAKREEISKSSKKRFREVFEERWEDVLGPLAPPPGAEEDPSMANSRGEQEQQEEKEEREGETFVTPPEDLSSRITRLLSAADAMNYFQLSPHELHIKCTGIPGQHSLLLGIDMEIVQVYAGKGSLPETNSEDADATASHLPFYIVNPSFPYFRERMAYMPHPSRTELPGRGDEVDREVNRPMSPGDSHGIERGVWGVMVVCFDGRECTWQEFHDNVIGDPDPCKASKTSFRGLLYTRWDVDEDLEIKSCPNVIDNGVQESAGSLQAFSERLQLFGSSDLIPDQLIRSMCMGGADPLLLADWSENPLVAYTSSYSHGEAKKEGIQPKVCRLFDLLYEMNTRDLIELVRTAEEHITIRSPPKDLRFPDPRMETLRNGHRVPPPLPPPSLSSTRPRLAEKTWMTFDAEHQPSSTSWRCTEGGEMLPVSSILSTGSKKPPISRARRQLNAAIARDAIVNAKDPDDIQDLWEYYRENSSCPDKKKQSSAHSSAGYGRLNEIRKSSKKNRISFFEHSPVIPTIDSELFYNDFAAVMNQYSCSKASKNTAFEKLFEEVRTNFKGQMNYNYFARALALFKAI